MDEQIDKAAQPLIELYNKVELDLLNKLAMNFKINEEFINSDYWRLQKLAQLGALNEETIKYLAKVTKTSEKAIKKAIEDIGISSKHIDEFNKLYKAGKTNRNPNILKDDEVLNAIMKYSYNETLNSFITISTKIEQGVRDAYLRIVEEVWLKTTIGTVSYQEAIKEAIDELGNSGIITLKYITQGATPKIRSYDIAGTARREILNSLRQLNANMTMQSAVEMDWDKIYISEHYDCRPTHFDWQGTIVNRSELVLPPIDYGEVTGLCGINCRHYFEPYFGDAEGDDLKKITKEEVEETYKKVTKQRYFERGIRQWKRKEEMFKVIGDEEEYKKSKKKVNWWIRRYDNYTKDNGLRRDYSREYI